MPAQEPLFQLLKDRAQTLSRNHRSLARYVLANYQRVAFATIKQLSALSGVSEATIVRFVKALDFNGYPAFQKEVRRIVRADLKGTERFKLGAQRPGSEVSPLAPIVQKEIENISALQEGFSRTDVQKAVQALRSAPEVMVAGARSTASLACHLWFGLTKLGIAAERVIAVTTETYDRVARLPRNAAVVVIGFPRYVRDLIDLLAFVRARGLRTITLTDNPVSPLHGDIHLSTPAESSSFVAFHCAPLILINHLLHELSLVDKKQTLAALNRFESLAEERRYFVSD
ncbi:MAG TPA: MurR/RpiR family transcriptional regulator [Desulfobacterales bacterium]|nr:MurR/RpiR family transcriptional regulator [Desulfobacterales bacterium]